MTDTAPTVAEADVAAYSVHDFQPTDIMPRDQVQPGQEFVRALPSKCVIHFEDDDVDIPDGVRALAGPGQALDTEAHHCACAVHAVFGAPSLRGKLAAPRARLLALSLLSQAPLKAMSSQTIRRKQRLLLHTFGKSSCFVISEGRALQKATCSQKLSGTRPRRWQKNVDKNTYSTRTNCR